MLKGKKTYIIASMMAMSVLAQLIMGDITFGQFFADGHVVTLLESLGLGSLRAGITSRFKV